MIVKTDRDVECLTRIGKIVAVTRDRMVCEIKAGVTTKELDEIAREILEWYGATSAPKKDYNFPGNTCISVNEEVAHGIPGDRIIKEGDVVNVDVSAELDGYYADTGISVVVGDDKIKDDVCLCAKEALYAAIDATISGCRISDLGKAIEGTAKRYGYKVIKNLTGHGIGKSLHEAPEYVLNYFDEHEDEILVNGMVLAIETFVSTKAQFVFQKSDDWTLITLDGSIVAQYEHTIIITEGKAVILTE